MVFFTRHLVGRKIVHDDDVATPERWPEALLEIGQESSDLVIGPSTTNGAAFLLFDEVQPRM